MATTPRAPTGRAIGPADQATVRRSNLSLVLRHLAERGRRSRAPHRRPFLTTITCGFEGQTRQVRRCSSSLPLFTKTKVR